MRTIVCDKCGKIIRMVRSDQVIKDDPIGKVSIFTVDKDGKVIERDLGKINEMEICPDCISKLIESFVKKGIAEQPDPSEMEKKHLRSRSLTLISARIPWTSLLMLPRIRPRSPLPEMDSRL